MSPKSPAGETTACFSDKAVWMTDWRGINAKGVFTTKDYVTKKLSTWIPLLEPIRDRPLSILEIGSLEGRSALFFLSYLKNAQITCIDPFFKSREPNFDKNLASYANRVNKIRDFSLPALIQLRQTDREFDLIYIDGCHERESVLVDSILSWGMLSLDGLLIWDDYGYKQEAANWERPRSAIDGFLVAYAGEYREETRSSQIIVRKIVATPRCQVRTGVVTVQNSGWPALIFRPLQKYRLNFLRSVRKGVLPFFDRRSLTPRFGNSHKENDESSWLRR
jgi:predicted O-methyltransferase YrrM